MTFLILKTLSPLSLPFISFSLLPQNSSAAAQNRNPNPRNRNTTLHCSLPSSEQTLTLETNEHYSKKKETERGLEFDPGDSFFRHESAIGRDLGVLAASLYKESKGNLRVLDGLCGCGIRSLRYLVQAKADFVWANDANEESRWTITSNLSRQVKDSCSSEEEKKWVVTHFDANRVMKECSLHKDFFDLIDIDSFGSDSSFIRSAFDALKLDGLLYLTSTDGYSSGGHRPHHSLASYGAFVRPMPYSNEVGLRMLIGGAIRDASVLGYRVTPLFSYYSYHGPVFRVMLQVNRGKLSDSRHYGFISYCTHCGNSQAFSWEQLGVMYCSCNKEEVPRPLIVSGPLWTGPLHDTTYVTEMLTLAKQWGWAGSGTSMDLEKLLTQMIDESDPELPFGYIKLDEVASRAKVNSPPLRTMMSTLHKEGYAASRSHIASNALKTNCPMSVCVRIARDLQLKSTIRGNNQPSLI